MDKLKIAFFGTSDRSIPILEELNKNFELVLCTTKKDVKFGRHQDLKPTAVKTWAVEHMVRVVTISSLKGLELEALIEQIKLSKADYILVADFSFIIPAAMLEAFGDKIINVHFSLLPLYRGASPVQFAILNGEKTTGITYHLLDRKMDSGKILHQIGYKIAGKETTQELYKTLFELAAANLPKVINDYAANLITPRAQDESKATFCYSPSHPESTFIYKEDGQIDWKKSAEEIERCIRAYNPWPIAWTTAGSLENNKRLCNSNIKLIPSINKDSKVKVFKARIEDDRLCIEELQFEGKNRIDWQTLENGLITKPSKK